MKPLPPPLMLVALLLPLLSACQTGTPQDCASRLAALPEEADEYNPPGSRSGEITLAIYEVSRGDLRLQDLPPVPESLAVYQSDMDGHRQIWDFFTAILPATRRTGVSRFVIFTDGPGGMLGRLTPVDGDQPSWSLEMDLQDAAHAPSLTVTLLHEFAHLFSLDASQMLPDREPCSTFPLAGECTAPESYLNLFYQQYWADLYEEWLALKGEEAGNALLTDHIYQFYNLHPDRFVSSYAASSPQEDLAESFLYYILLPLPDGSTMAEEKMLFFDHYDDLAELRRQIRLILCERLLP